jgi:hypothetical protein
MITAMDTEFTSNIGISSSFDILYVSSVHSDRDIVLGLACDSTSMASNALAIVDDETVIYHLSNSP